MEADMSIHRHYILRIILPVLIISLAVSCSDSEDEGKSAEIIDTTETSVNPQIVESSEEDTDIKMAESSDTTNNPEASESDQGQVDQVFKIYGSDAMAEKLLLRKEISVDASASLQDMLTALADALSQEVFYGLPIVVTGVETSNGKTIAHVDLREIPPGQTNPPNKNWVNNFFQGTAGADMTSRALVETFLQKNFSGTWIDGVDFSYEGEPILEAKFPHLWRLQGLILRQ